MLVLSVDLGVLPPPPPYQKAGYANGAIATPTHAFS